MSGTSITQIAHLHGRTFKLILRPPYGYEFVMQPEPAGTVPRETVVPDIRRIAWGARVSQTFRNRVCWIADKLEFDPSWLMACIAFETARTFSPAVRNPNSSATGLIQFMAKTARSLGTTTDHLAQMTAEDQLAYVYRYLEGVGLKGRAKDVESVYMAILMPRAIAFDCAQVIISKEEASYAVNRGLDLNRDGVITKAEAGAKVRALLAEGERETNVWEGPVETGIVRGDQNA